LLNSKVVSTLFGFSTMRRQEKLHLNFHLNNQTLLNSMEIVEAITNDLAINPTDAVFIFQRICQLIKNKLSMGEPVGMPGLGILYINQRTSKQSLRNLLYGTRYTYCNLGVDSKPYVKNSVKFKPCNDLKRSNFPFRKSLNEFTTVARERLLQMRCSEPVTTIANLREMRYLNDYRRAFRKLKNPVFE